MALPSPLQPGGSVRTGAAVVGAIPLATAQALVTPLANAVKSLNESVKNNPINKALDASGGAIAAAFNKISGREAPTAPEKQVATNIKDSTSLLEDIRNILLDQAIANKVYQKKDLELKEEIDREEDRKLRKIGSEKFFKPDASLVSTTTTTSPSAPVKQGMLAETMTDYLKTGLTVMFAGGLLITFKDQILDFLRALFTDPNENAGDPTNQRDNLEVVLDSNTVTANLSFSLPGFNANAIFSNNIMTDFSNANTFGEQILISTESLTRDMFRENYTDLPFARFPEGHQFAGQYDFSSFDPSLGGGMVDDTNTLISAYAINQMLGTAGKYGNSIMAERMLQRYLPEGVTYSASANRFYKDGKMIGREAVNDLRRASLLEKVVGKSSATKMQDKTKTMDANKTTSRTGFQKSLSFLQKVSGPLLMMTQAYSGFKIAKSYDEQTQMIDQFEYAYNQLSDEEKAMLEQMYPDFGDGVKFFAEAREKLFDNMTKSIAEMIGMLTGAGSAYWLANKISKARSVTKNMKTGNWMGWLADAAIKGGVVLVGGELGKLSVGEITSRLQHTMRAEPHVFKDLYKMYETLDKVFAQGNVQMFRGDMEGPDGELYVTPQNIESVNVDTGLGDGTIYGDIMSDPRILGATTSDRTDPNSPYYIAPDEVIQDGQLILTEPGNGGGASGTDVIESTEEVNERKENRGGSQRDLSQTNVVAPNTTTVVNRQDNSYNASGDSTNILATQKAVV